MTTNHVEVPAFPNIRAIVRPNGTGEVIIAGNSRPIEAPDETELRRVAIAVITSQANVLERPVRVYTEGPEGDGELIVHPDGNIEEVATETKGRRMQTASIVESAAVDTAASKESGAATGASNKQPARDTPTSQITPLDPETSAPSPTIVEYQEQTASATTTSEEAPIGRRALRESGSFLVSTPVIDPATRGWRGFWARLGFKVAPSDEELAEREDVRLVSQHWPGPRKIAVVNRKGGSSKTPTVAMLSAVLARYSGAATAAFDNNESQGTLGWRTEQGGHSNSVLDLVDSSAMLLAPDTNAAEIARFVHHQTSDKYDVLRSDENDEGDHEVTAEEVDIAHQVLTRYYRLIVMDSGNTARSANWRQMIHHTDQLVVPVTAAEDRAEAARKTLQTLESRGGHDADLARNAVVIVSEATDAKHGMSGEALNRSKAEAQRIADAFTPYVRAVARIPYDPAMVNGSLRYDALRPDTQRAWLAAAAEVAQGL